MNSKRKIALVTGAGQNTGRGIALRLAKEGADIVLVDKDAASLNDTADEITATGRRVSVFLIDITGREQLRDAVDHAEKIFGNFDIMVNNPGFEREDAEADIGYEEAQRLINHSIQSTLWGIQVAADKFRQRRQKGTIINISSSAGHENSSLVDIHTASKMAVRVLTQAASKELATDGIMVTLQCFGTIIPAARYVS
ncbi:SDR family NAD(P)-dependent oxidoreductase [Pseudomonas sp. PDM26]|uniref:SDR family NAD(P)-dependent oxidoreductase n=1 Tax=Pseudomonas sp. PDM26 TaxID=2854766 RepID=UPI001C481DFA|nr:SDR family NAD(P)-dependent oxidoreductase [Pseudomonas sp. PDM26]MBV7546505.1 SDR family NAD(P)-dependent oxidoreductase [Pseudomonas sp. PDM26]